MIKVLANKALAFTRGEKDTKGYLVREKTTVGFCELSDWVAETPYFKAALADGSINAVSSSSESESVLKAQEKLAALQDEIKELEEKRDLMSATEDAVGEPKEIEKPQKVSATKNTNK